MLWASFAEFLVKMFFVRVSMVGQYLHVNTWPLRVTLRPEH